MTEILDQEIYDEKESNSTLTSNIKLRVFIYLTVMIIGGMLYMKYISNFKPDLYNMICGSLTHLAILLTFTSLTSVIRYFVRKRKASKSGVKIKYDPIWFEIIENAFSWWILLSVITVVGQFI